MARAASSPAWFRETCPSAKWQKSCQLVPAQFSRSLLANPWAKNTKEPRRNSRIVRNPPDRLQPLRAMRCLMTPPAGSVSICPFSARHTVSRGAAFSCLVRPANRAKTLVVDICTPDLAGTRLHVASCIGGRGDSQSVRGASTDRSGRRFPGAGSLRRDFLESHLKSRPSRQPGSPGPGLSILRPTPGSCAAGRDMIRGGRAP